MQLIGMLDSPFVWRVAVSANLLGVPFDHRPLSVFRNFDQFAAINPVVKAPTLITDDGVVLIDSTLILDYIEDRGDPEHSLMPLDRTERTRALRLIGLGLAACEKTVQIAYERNHRPPEKQHVPWLDRVGGQLAAAYDLIEAEIVGAAHWIAGERITQADVTIAIAWRFTKHTTPGAIEVERYPNLAALSGRAEALPEFVSAPLV